MFESWESDEAAQTFYTGQMREAFERFGIPQPEAERLETLTFARAPAMG